MAKHIAQKITFKKSKPEALFELYMNGKKHALISWSPVTISSKACSPFSAYGGYITGKIIHTVKDKFIVQSWRSADWTPDDPDSIFTRCKSKASTTIVITKRVTFNVGGRS